jgi:hypothetical protein
VLFLLVCLYPILCPAQSIWELTPYKVQIYVTAAPSPRLSAAFQQEMLQSLHDRLGTVVGAAWQPQVDTAPEDLAREMVIDQAGVTVEHLPSACLEADKVFLVAFSTDYGGDRVRVRELDVRTRQWGTPVERLVGQPALLGETALQSVIAAFAPLAQVDAVEDKVATLRIRAAGLPFRDASIQPLAIGDIFRAILRFNDREGKLRTDRPPPQPAPWTVLVLDEFDGQKATCQIYSGLRSPLSSRRRGRSEQLALVARPADFPTELELISRTDPSRRLFGYEVFAHSPGSPETTLLGRTGRDGKILIESSDEPLRMLIVKSGGEFLARLPLVPGLDRAAAATLPDDDQRLAVEGIIFGLQEQLVDVVARRAVLAARIRAKLEEGKAEEAQELLKQLHSLPTRNDLFVLLNDERKKHFSGDTRVQAKINKLFDDTTEVLRRNLSPEELNQITAEVNAAKAAGE